MRCCGGGGSGNSRNREIEEQLQRDAEVARKEQKLLLLGPGESGKSTIFKQMKIIQSNGGFSQQELQDYIFTVYGNAITQMKVLVTVVLKLGKSLEKSANESRAKRIAAIPAGGDSWTPEVAADIKALWADKTVQNVYELRDKKYHLNESAAYFFDNIDRIADANYLPTYQDVLRARVRTTGIQEAVFTFEDHKFRMLDVGGQRSERRKWIHCFDHVTAVLFVAALSEFDQTLREGDNENRMLESLALFSDICNSKWFKETAFILFLNKVDLFRTKVAKLDMKKYCFPNYTGGHDFDAAKEYVKNQFREKNTSSHSIFVHFTCAISTENMEFVMTATRETILQKVMNETISGS